MADEPRWVALAKLADLPADAGREVAHGGRAYALFRLGDRAVALAGRCPHQGAHLASGPVDPARGTVTCPRRGCLRWRFDLATGAGVDLVVACPTFPARVVDGVVEVALPAGRGGDDPDGRPVS